MSGHEQAAFAPPPSASEQSAEARPGLNVTVNELLNSAEVQTMPPAEQGKFIVDRMVGAVVAAHQEGQFNGASHSLNTAKEVLESASGSAVRTPTGLQLRIDTVTRAGGLREAVIALARDRRTAPWLPHLSSHLQQDQYGQPLLTTIAQAEGYVLGIKPGEYASWKEPVIRDVRKAAKNSYIPEWDSNTPLHYGGPDLQRERGVLRAEIDRARGDNVDLPMLSASLGAMQRIDQRYQGLGKPSPSVQAPEAPIVGLPQQGGYDYLFS